MSQEYGICICDLRADVHERFSRDLIGISAVVCVGIVAGILRKK